MTSVNVEALSFVDVSENTRGSFVKPENLDRFLDSEVGKAQEKLLREQIQEQGVEPTDSTIRRALFHEQNYQDLGYREPDLTTQELLDDYGPSWYERLTNTFEAAGAAVSEAVDGVVREIGPATPNPDDPAYVGRGGAARDEAIQRAVDDAVGPSAAPLQP